VKHPNRNEKHAEDYRALLATLPRTARESRKAAIEVLRVAIQSQ
jgi:hypothetical protein